MKDGRSNRVLIVVGRFYEDIAAELVEGAAAELRARDIEWDVVDVPGAFEIPSAIKIFADRGAFDGYVALGCVIRGETTHYDYVCGESARGIMELGVKDGVAIGYGILTTENREQAMERAAVKRKNKGRDAVIACCTLIDLKVKGLTQS